jgi:hypothetical protein
MLLVSPTWGIFRPGVRYGVDDSFWGNGQFDGGHEPHPEMMPSLIE